MDCPSLLEQKLPVEYFCSEVLAVTIKAESSRGDDSD